MHASVAWYTVWASLTTFKSGNIRAAQQGGAGGRVLNDGFQSLPPQLLVVNHFSLGLLQAFALADIAGDLDHTQLAVVAPPERHAALHHDPPAVAGGVLQFPVPVAGLLDGRQASCQALRKPDGQQLLRGPAQRFLTGIAIQPFRSPIPERDPLALPLPDEY